MAKRQQSGGYQQQLQNNPGLTAGLASGVAGGVMNAGGVTVSSCPADDQSFYCKFVRGFNVFKMLLFIIFIIVAAYFIYIMFFANKKKR
jgi:hypothetical protein